jgi:hypothetical protein
MHCITIISPPLMNCSCEIDTPPRARSWLVNNDAVEIPHKANFIAISERATADEVVPLKIEAKAAL